MTDIARVLIIGNADNAGKIKSLFSKGGFTVQQAEHYTKDLSPADLVIEAVPGDTPAKKKVLLGITGQNATIFATTATCDFTAIAAGPTQKTPWACILFLTRLKTSAWWKLSEASTPHPKQ